MADTAVSITEICRILSGEGHEPLTKMAISHFVRDGMPQAARGKYQPVVCMTWYIGRLRTSVKRKESESEDGEILSLDKEQTRLIKAKADNEEMTAAERRGELVPIARYEEDLARVVGTVRMQFLNLPDRIAPRLLGLTRNEAKGLLRASVKDVLAGLAKQSHGHAKHTPAPAAPAKRARARTAKKPPKRKR